MSDPARRHAPPKILYKTTLVVWTEVDPNAARVLRWDALGILSEMEDRGTAYVSTADCVPLNPHEVAEDPAWDGAEFFDKEETTNE